MGLVVSAFGGLSPAPDSQAPLAEGFYDPARKWVRLAPPADFIAESDGIAPGVYSYREAILCFEAGPYSGFSRWREWLAKLAGYEPTDHPDYRHCPHLLSSWLVGSGPLHDYLNFSDCEGVVGSVTSRRIAQDFVSLRAQVVAVAPDALDHFDRWTSLFELGASGGAVVYH